MPTRRQVLDAGGGERDYERAGRALSIPAGQAYMVATGLPADGGDAWTEAELRRPGAVEGSTQHLVYSGLEIVNPVKKESVDAWVRRRAESDPPMIAAARARDADSGEPDDSEDTDVADVLTRRHDRVTALLEQLKAIPGVSKGGSPVHQSRRQSIADMIVVAASKHETAEEEYFWPAVRDALDDGDEVAAEALSQEQKGAQGLAALGQADPSDPEFDELAEELEKDLRKHVAFEDKVLLRIKDAMPEPDRRVLGQRIAEAEERAPTRPHPHAPTHPGPAVKAAASGGAALDRLRDKTGDRPADRKGRAEHEPHTQDTEEREA